MARFATTPARTARTSAKTSMATRGRRTARATTAPTNSRRRKLGAQAIEHVRRRAHAQASAGFVVLLGQHRRALVDRVDHALQRPRHLELGLFDLATEV